MSFIRSAFAAAPLHSREEYMATSIRLAAELEMPDERGAAVCDAMCMFQEAGGDPHDTGAHQIWCPGNDADPCFNANPAMFPHDSMGDDGRSVGPHQQQTSGPPPATQWGWGGNYGNPEGTRKRMDMVESSRMFLAALKRKGYDASGPRCANDAIQAVQGSDVPDAYGKWWGEANELYDQVAGGVVVPKPAGGFTGDPVWLEDVLRADLGDRLKVMDDWQSYGNGDGWQGGTSMGPLWGVMIHHTGNSRETVDVIRNGRADLSGPLSQCLIKPNGECWLVAVGPCNHAGVGAYPGIVNANQQLIGFECAWPTIRPDGSYDPGERWPDAQILTMRDATTAVLRKLGSDQTHVIGHKDWAHAPPNVKWDPGNMSMAWFQGEVGKDLRGEFDKAEPPKPPVVPPQPAEIDYLRQTWEQTRGRWAQLGDQTFIEALAEIRDHLTGTNDRHKDGVRFD